MIFRTRGCIPSADFKELRTRGDESLLVPKTLRFQLSQSSPQSPAARDKGTGQAMSKGRGEMKDALLRRVRDYAEIGSKRDTARYAER